MTIFGQWQAAPSQIPLRRVTMWHPPPAPHPEWPGVPRIVVIEDVPRVQTSSKLVRHAVVVAPRHDNPPFRRRVPQVWMHKQALMPIAITRTAVIQNPSSKPEWSGVPRIIMADDLVHIQTSAKWLTR